MATILVVDDDDAVGAVIQQHLTDSGHRVFVARGTRDALAALATRPSLDLMIVDLVMPVTTEQVADSPQTHTTA